MSERVGVPSTSPHVDDTEHSIIVETRLGSPRASRRPMAPGAYTNNPLRIDRIGTDHLEVVIRPVHGRTELLALVERLEQLIDAGYDTLDVADDRATHEVSAPDESVQVRDTVTSGAGMGTSTDAKAPPTARA